MRSDAWIPLSIPPVEAGSYLVTTYKGKIRIDRYDGEGWGLCKPRTHSKYRNRGRYKEHRGWTHLPRPMEERTEE